MSDLEFTNPVISRLTCDAHNMPFLKAFRKLSCGFTYDLLSKLKTLTPIWTGGVERNDSSKLHLTGIKGSIRWWMETLIRGLGVYYACNSGSKNKDDKCEFNTKAYEKTKNLDTPAEKSCNF